jgi:quinoprotein glucose dehydrogenase
MKKKIGFLALSVGLASGMLGTSHANAQTESSGQDWAFYNGSAGGQHYSSLKQINRRNVSQLKEVWRYDTGEEGGLETSPLVIHGVLYGYTPTQEVIALDAATGKLLWKFNSGIVGTQPARGLAYWSEKGSDDGRIFAGIMNFVYALDAKTGKVVPGFGDHGRIDLREDLGREPKLQSITLTSPGAIYKDLIIFGGREPESLPAPPGDIRAYDVRTGKLRWSFHTIPHPGEAGYDTWPKNAWTYSGGANNWAGMVVDAERGIVYAPTGSAATDFYGADRVGDDLFADSLIALNAETGKRIWSFQDVRHDIWDRDLASPPALITVERDGKKVPAVAQTTKSGFLYLFDRRNGKPLFPIEYRKVPSSTVPGEVAAAEQPFPLKPAPFARQQITAAMLTNRTPAAHAWALEQFRGVRSEGQFVPLSLGFRTIVQPGFEGGAEWGGPAVDPETDIIYINSNDYPSIGLMAKHTAGGASGRGIYLSQCSVCHGENLAGSPPQFPSLIDIGVRLNTQQIIDKIHTGGGRMPAFPAIQGDSLDALIGYLNQKAGHGFDSVMPEHESASTTATYNLTGYHRFEDPEGYPGVAPPWGTLNAINLNTGEYVWKIPLGQYPALAAKGMPDTGSENYGGSVVTAGGVLFIGATCFDNKFRAFDKATGKLLWQATLPFPANATPATYKLNGRQYIVIATGGGKLLKRKSGGMYVAFALPQ